MSWYFLGGFSAYWMLPSARFLNHAGCSLTQGGRVRTERRCPARSRCRARRRACTAAGSRPACPARSVSRRARLRQRPRPRGCRHPRAGVERVVPALAASSGRSGGSAGSKARRSPCAAHKATRLRNRRRCRGAGHRRRPSAGRTRTRTKSGRARAPPSAGRPLDRPARASGRGGAWRSDRATSSRPSAFNATSEASAFTAWASSTDQARSNSTSPESVARPAACFDQRGTGLRGDAQVFRIDAPDEIVPPGQEGVHPGAHRCTASRRWQSTVNAARQRSLPSATIGCRGPGFGCRLRRHSNSQATTSWPSAKQSASTRTASPTMRLAGKRPPSTLGVTLSMTTRTRPSDTAIGVTASAVIAQALRAPASGCPAAADAGSVPESVHCAGTGTLPMTLDVADAAAAVERGVAVQQLAPVAPPAARRPGSCRAAAA